MAGGRLFRERLDPVLSTPQKTLKIEGESSIVIAVRNAKKEMLANMKHVLTLVLGLVLLAVGAEAQNADVPGQLGYPQMIVYNGKIVTMDDSSFESKVGTIVQAMAIRDGKILATGTNAKIKALVGPSTKTIDLKGRTAMPSFILAQEHPTDWVFSEPHAFRHILPGDDVIISRWMPSVPGEQQLAMFEPMMREAVAKARPGQWIRTIFNYGPNYQWAEELRPIYHKSIRREWLDQLAPNNPVAVSDGFVSSVYNTKAIEEYRTVHRDIDFDETGRRGGQPDPERQRRIEREGVVESHPVVEPDAMLKGKLPVLAELLKAEMEVWASWGATTFGSAAYAYNNLQALDLLDKKGEMPGRYAWTYSGPSWDLETLRVLAATLGHGTDRLWFIGAFSDRGGDCTSAPEKAEWKELHERPGVTKDPGELPGCVWTRGTRARETLERIVESGMRIATTHTGGDKDVDNFMDAIEEGSRKAGFTLEEIRAKRHAFDHGTGAPRPDQIPRVKKLGLIASEGNVVLWETFIGAVVTEKQYGIEYTDWVVPRKRMADAGIPTSFEVDRPLPYKMFFLIAKGMNRYNETTQKVYGPNQKTDRIIQLKALTRWGAFYVLRENSLGTLEPGKFADFIVLDKDILTVPENQIPSIRVLMTTMGGKVVHLTSAFATEIGLPAVGATTWKEPISPGWE